eukprot:1158624-Pelagomonas_calceolata.AAC.5
MLRPQHAELLITRVHCVQCMLRPQHAKLLITRVPEVMGAYAAHVSNVQVRSDGPWACVTALRIA